MSKDVIDPRRRHLLITASAMGGVGAVASAVPFLASFQPSARTKAIGAPVEVNITKLEPGQRITEQWRGKPVWIVRRSNDTLARLETDVDLLRDPGSEEEQQPSYARNPFRSVEPEFLVVVGLCTHLGCSPTYLAPGAPNQLGSDWHGGFFCPCHGSKFDLSGRVFKGVPALLNLLVPPYKFKDTHTLIIGVDEGEVV
jgi:ubiquinol-cytochrome c reductase iron-sulfur subunit